MSDFKDNDEPSTDINAFPQSKATLREWLESFLPFRLPSIPLPKVAKNLDLSAARLLTGGTNNLLARMDVSTGKQKALGTAAVEYIEVGTAQIRRREIDSDDMQALAYVLNEAKLKQNNRRKILELTCEDLTSTPPTDEASGFVSDDWLNVFSRYASEKSESDIQFLWSRILSGEIRRPGSVSLRVLAQLATLDKDDAAFTHRMLKCAMNGESIYSQYFDNTNLYHNVLRAQDIGIIGSLAMSKLKLNPSKLRLAIGSAYLLLDVKNEVELTYSVFPLTILGRCLHKFLSIEEVEDEYIASLINELKKPGMTVYLLRHGSTQPKQY